MATSGLGDSLYIPVYKLTQGGLYRYRTMDEYTGTV